MIRNRDGAPLVLRNRDGEPLTPQLVEHGSLVDPATPAGVQPVGHSGYELAFSDEFASGSLDTTKWLPWYPDTPFWNTTVPGGHKTNTAEPQGYDPSAITFDADGMVFTLREEETVPGLAYTSGMVCSFPSFNPTYGYFEARMLLSDTVGAWPAFWMMPTAQVRYPETDWAENDGKASFNVETYHTFHSDQLPGGKTSSVHEYPQDVGSSWHTFGGLWEPDRIRWYVDGVVVKDFATDLAGVPMYLICNLAGQQGSAPAVPASIHVAYIRAWALPTG